jgi:hypothetical protein
MKFRKFVLSSDNDIEVAMEINSTPLRALQLIRELENENRKLTMMIEEGIGFEEMSNPDDEINPHSR